MSPFARSLLALACAALLRVAFAQQLQCSNAQQGNKEGAELVLNEITVKPYYGPIFSFPVDNWCARQQIGALRGETVRACDDVAPLIQISSDGLTITVQRLGTMALEMKIYIKQYCA